MSATPVGQAPIAFALIVRKGGVDFIEAPIRYLGGLDDTARFSTSVEHDPAFAGPRSVRLVFRATGCGLHALDYKSKQFICELGTVAEGERAEVLIPFGDRLAHGLAKSSENDGFRRDGGGQPSSPGPVHKWHRGRYPKAAPPASAIGPPRDILHRRAISVATGIAEVEGQPCIAQGDAFDPLADLQ